MFEIEYYEADNGKIPVYDFINKLPMKIRIKAFASLKILSEYGNNLREPYSKYIDKGIFELRIKFSTDITRIFYFFIKDNKNLTRWHNQRLWTGTQNLVASQ